MTTNDIQFDDFLQSTIERDCSAMGGTAHSFAGTMHKIEQRRAASSQRQKIAIRVVSTMILALIVTNILLLTTGNSDSMTDDGFISESTSYFTEILQ